MATIYSNTLVTEATTVRKNLVINPSFETNTTDWLAYSATISRDPATFYSGVASLKVVCAGTTSGESAYKNNSAVSGLTKGQEFSSSAWVKAPANALLEIVCASQGAGAANVVTFFTGTGAWQYVKAESAIVGASLNPYVIIRTRSTAQAITFYVDNVILEMTPTIGDYFDGSTTDADGIFYDWTGTVNASISTAKTSAFTPQIITGWTTYQNSRNVVHEIIGKASPDVTILPGSTRSGSVETVFTTQADAENARLVLSNGTTFTIKDSETWNNGYTFVTNGTIKQELEEVTRDLWTVTFDYTEITA